MTGWPRWDRPSAPGALIHYVQRDVSSRLVPGIPGPSAELPVDRLREAYQALAAAGVTYADEPTGSRPGRQAIRPPDQVLLRPKTGNCLDLAVVFAGCCLDAGLHPMIVLLDAERTGAPGHAIVVAWLGGDWRGEPDPDYPLRGIVHPQPPREVVDDLRARPRGPGAFAALDVAQAATARPPFDEAMAAGARLLRTMRWSAGIDIGSGWDPQDTLPMPGWPDHDPLTPGYLPPDPQAGPLEQLRARRGAIKFYARDELDLLLDWCQAPDADGPRTRIALVHGVGGAGKTHLSAELCARLTRENWYPGFLPRDPDPADLDWFGTIVSPLLVVADYAEAARTTDIRNLLRAVRGRASATCVVLTARAVTGWWDDLSGYLTDGGYRYLTLDVPLPDRHPRPTGVFRTALRAFATTPGDHDVPVPSGRWTTLDLVMHAWLAAHGETELPRTTAGLYDKILDHEFDYWRRTFVKRHNSEPPRRLLRRSAACLTLLAPTGDRLGHVLAAATDRYRDEIADLVTDLLPADPGDETITLRPDPVGDHLLLAVFGGDQDLLARCMDRASADSEQTNACVAISRSAQEDPDQAARLAAALLRHKPELWRVALGVVAAQGGPFVSALEDLARSDDTPLPLAELAARLPFGHVALANLALIAADRTLRDIGSGDAPDEEDRARLAAALGNLANRLAEAGDRQAALEPARRAEQIYRQLAQASPAAHLPDLATSLNNLANHLAETGDRQAALEPAREAVTIGRQLAQASPAAHLPDLAASLNNLAVRLAEAGDRQAALEPAREAVTIRRQLAQASPAAYLPDLAASLNTLAIRLAETGDRQAALEPARQAEQIYRQLTQASPAAHLPGLAASLNNLAIGLAETGDRQAALEPAREAVTIYRQLAQDSPAAHLPDLATSLNTIASLIPADEGSSLFEGALESLPPGPQAELLLAKSSWRTRNGDEPGAAEDLRRAAIAADQEADPAWAGRSRRAVRSAAASVADPTYPSWATEPLPDEILEACNRWLAARTWDDAEQMLRDAHASLLTAGGQRALAATRALYPEFTRLASLSDVLAEIAAQGLDPVLDSLRAANRRADLVRQWQATLIGAASREYLKTHPELLDDPRSSSFSRRTRSTRESSGSPAGCGSMRYTTWSPTCPWPPTPRWKPWKPATSTP
jgi:hypothetical protein